MASVTTSELITLVADRSNVSESRVRDVMQNYTGYVTKNEEPQTFLDIFRFYDTGSVDDDLSYKTLGYQVGDLCSILGWSFEEVLNICLCWRDSVLRLVAQREEVVLYNAAKLATRVHKGNPKLSVTSSVKVSRRPRVPARVQREFFKLYSTRNGYQD